MSNHTPAPWSVSNFTTGSVFSGNNMVASVYPCEMDDESKSIEREANANLIAAAPDMLEALIGMMNVTVMSKNGELEKARAAIAKATGEA
ncbi:MAG: hypothetical protein WBI40_10675 [Methylococcaceae bacterium]